MAQTVFNADAASPQPNINRDEKGFTSCGIRIVAVAMEGAANSFAYDFSVTMYKDAFALMKAGQQSIPFDKKKGWDISKLKIKTPGPDSFWLAKRDDNLTLKPTKYIKSDDPGYMIGGADVPAAIKMIWAITNGEPMQISLRYPADRYDRIIAFKITLSADDKQAIESCLGGLAERMQHEMSGT